jgi:hypothetical protein
MVGEDGLLKDSGVSYIKNTILESPHGSNISALPQ